MPKDEVPSEDGMKWLASQLGDGARPALPDEYSPRQSPRWPRTSRIVPPAPVEPTTHTGVFLWGLKPTAQPDPRLAKGAAARAAATAAAAAAAAVVPAAPVPSSAVTPEGPPSAGPSNATGAVPTTTAALFVVTPAKPARVAAGAAAPDAGAAADSAAVAGAAPTLASAESSGLQPVAFAPSSAASTDDSAAELIPAGPRSPSASVSDGSVSDGSGSDGSGSDASAPEPLPPVEAPAPLMVPGGVGPDESDGSRGIRSEQADLAPAPWWTTLTQSPLELTAEEIAAADLLAGRTPPAPAPEPAPLPAPVSARGRLRARLAATLSAPAPLAGQTQEPGSAVPAPVTPAPGARAVTRLAEAAAHASAALRVAVAPADTPTAPPLPATPVQPADAATPASVAAGSPDPAPAAAAATADTGLNAAATTPRASSGASSPVTPVGPDAAAAPRPASGTTFAASKAGPRSAVGAVGAAGAAGPASPVGAAGAATPRPALGANASVGASGPRSSSGATSSGSGAGTAPPASSGRPPGGRRPGKPRLLVWIAGGLVLVLALVALFFLGQSLVGGGDAAPVAVPTSSATPTPSAASTAPPEATGPQPVGEHPWDTLFGGECLQPYVTPWEEEFTVADCATPHAAQLVYRGSFAGDAATAFPGEAELAGQINLLCSASGVIDLAAASAYDDVQVQGSYPITEEQWSEGTRYYYCFVSRASGEPLTASIAGPGPAPAA